MVSLHREAPSSERTAIGGRLERLEGLWAQMHGAWVQLKAYEAARVAEEAEMYKNRNKSTEIKSQDVRPLPFLLHERFLLLFAYWGIPQFLNSLQLKSCFSTQSLAWRRNPFSNISPA